MKTVPLTRDQKALVREYSLAPKWQEGRHRIFDINEIRAAEQDKTTKLVKADSEYFTSQEFRDDVMLELMEQGATLEQATNRTRDQARLFNEASQLGMM
jgi:hypothetical protein